MLLFADCALDAGGRGRRRVGGVHWRNAGGGGDASPLEPLSGLWAAFAYAGAGRELLARLKYRNQRSSVRWLASAMVGALPAGLAVDAVTWAPTSPQRRRSRGFDQAELLARSLGREAALPVVGLLRRVDTLQDRLAGAAVNAPAPQSSPLADLRPPRFWWWTT